MKTISKEDLKIAIEQHRLWLAGEGGARLVLIEYDLSWSNLSRSNLSGSDLSGSNLSRSDLSGSDLSGSDLSGSDLSGSNLSWSNLSRSNLSRSDLSRSDLSGSDLSGSDLSGSDLSRSDLPNFLITPEEGQFVGFKKTTTGVIRILIPEHAQRTSSLIGRKCRASSVIPMEEGGSSPTAMDKLTYKVDVEVFADKFDDDIRIECTNGIHFFMTRKEAEEY